MIRTRTRHAPIYRIWIVTYQGRRPQQWHKRPSKSRQLELADSACYSHSQAQAFLQGFNSQMLTLPQKLWAEAVPVG